VGACAEDLRYGPAVVRWLELPLGVGEACGNLQDPLPRMLKVLQSLLDIRCLQGSHIVLLQLNDAPV
jgi:hypothetical protein